MSHNKGAAGRKMAWVVAFRTAESAVADVRGSCRIWSKAPFQAGLAGHRRVGDSPVQIERGVEGRPGGSSGG
ncbi:hypothetical protein AAHB34_08780 [Paenarthrobacter ureafaciens]